jgi:hypothetical protein
MLKYFQLNSFVENILIVNSFAHRIVLILMRNSFQISTMCFFDLNSTTITKNFPTGTRRTFGTWVLLSAIMNLESSKSSSCHTFHYNLIIIDTTERRKRTKLKVEQSKTRLKWSIALKLHKNI